MKDFKKIVLTFALFIAILIPSKIFASTTNVKTEAEFIASLKTSGTIVIDSDITLNSRVNISDVNLVIDLNGKTITFANTARLQMQKGSLEITGTGTMKEENANTAPLVLYGSADKDAENYTVVTIGKDATLTGRYGMFINKGPVDKNTAFGVVAHVYGTLLGQCNSDRTTCGAGIYINGTVNKTEGNVPVINIHKGAVLADGVAGGIYAAGYAKWNIEDVNLDCGYSGIAIKAGIFNLKNVTVVNKAEYKESSFNGNGINATGAAIQIESNNEYAGKIDITIDGGSYTSLHGYAIQHYLTEKNNVLANNMLKSLTINDAKAISLEKDQAITAIDNDNIKVVTGTFSSSVSKYIAEEYVEEKVNNEYVVAKKEVRVDTPTIDTTKEVVEVKEVTIGVKKDDTVTEILQEALKADKTLVDAVKDINAVVEVSVENQEEKVVPKEAAEEITKVVKEAKTEEKAEMKVASFFDITLNVKNNVTGDKLGTLSELGKKLTFNVALPEEITKVEEGYTRTYYIVRYHDGKAEILDTKISGNILTFETDKFSTYAIAYTDVKTSAVINPGTGDNIILYITAGIMATVGIAYTVFNIYKRKNN